jgi:hypothetical protein
MPVPHPFDIVAILLGIFLALRKSDVRAEDHARHPRVALADFDRWREAAIRGYTIGIRVCFAKVLLDFGFLAVLQHFAMDLGLQRGIGVSLDLMWIAGLVACWVSSRRAQRLAERSGVDLTRNPASDQEPAPDTSDRAA